MLGNETTGQRQWQGVIKFVAIHNRALTPAQIQQNFAAGVGQRYYLLFGVGALSGVSQSYILFQGSQYDNYSYLFDQPRFISLDPNATVPANLPISGIRIGVNGTLAPAGQSFATMNAAVVGANYTAATGQLLSNLGTVIPVQLGSANDLFFLSFDQVGSHVHAFVEPPGTRRRRCPTTPRSRTSVLRPSSGSTTRWRASPACRSPIRWCRRSTTAAQQSMPAGPLISAFLPSHQTAISQLANAYCGELLANAQYRDAFFGTGLDASLSMNVGDLVARRPRSATLVINALATNAVGTDVSPAAYHRGAERGGRAAARCRRLNGRRHRLDRYPGRLHRDARQRRGDAAVTRIEGVIADAHSQKAPHGPILPASRSCTKTMRVRSHVATSWRAGC